MADNEQLQVLRSGVGAWNLWRSTQGVNKPDLEGAELSGVDLSGADLRGAILDDAVLLGADLVGADFRGASLRGANLQEADLSYVQLQRADLRGCSLVRADLSRANLANAWLLSANLTHCTLYRVYLSNTKLRGVIVDADHPVMRDGSETIEFSFRDNMINWSRLRSLGRLPIFGVSWSALAVTLFVVNIIGALNDSQLVATFNYPIPIPDRIVLVLLDTLLLAVGSTCYRIACPLRVQEFSETAWVEQHRNPRLLYLAESLRRRKLQWLTLFLTAGGGLLALYLLGERILVALRYIGEQWSRELPGIIF